MQPFEIMGLPADQTASKPVDALVHAIAQRDIAAVTENVTPEALHAPENSLKGFVNQIGRKGLTITPTLVGKLYDNRASVRAFLTHPERPDWVQGLWFLVERRDGQWLVAGATKSRPLVGLFLQGLFSAEMTVADLPDDASLTEWANQLSPEDIQGFLSLGKYLPEELLNAELRVRSCRSLRERGIVFLEGARPASPPETNKACVLVEKTAEDDWTATGLKTHISLESFVAGMDIPWAPEEEEEEENGQ